MWVKYWGVDMACLLWWFQQSRHYRFDPNHNNHGQSLCIYSVGHYIILSLAIKLLLYLLGFAVFLDFLGVQKWYCFLTYKTLNCIYFTTITMITRLQIGHKVILLGGELIRNIFSKGKPSEFLPWIKKTLAYSCRLWDSSPRPPSHSVVASHPG